MSENESTNANNSNDANEPRGFRYGVRHAVVQAPMSLIDFVSQELALETKRSELTALELIELGSVYVDDDRTLNSAMPLKPETRVRIHSSPRRFPVPPDLRDRIVSETADTLLVDKPAGLPVHALVDNIRDNLLSNLEELRGDHLFITHRLDVDTSGLVLFAKNREAQAKLNRAFGEGTVKRTYAAYVENSVQPGDYVHFMEPSPKAPKHVELEARDGWSRCAMTVISCEEMTAATDLISEGYTTWKLVDSAANGLKQSPLEKMWRLEIKLQTGRPQQIRAQLTALKAPIIGDVLYGSARSLIEVPSEQKAIALRAAALEIEDALK